MPNDNEVTTLETFFQTTKVSDRSLMKAGEVLHGAAVLAQDDGDKEAGELIARLALVVVAEADRRGLGHRPDAARHSVN